MSYRRVAVLLVAVLCQSALACCSQCGDRGNDSDALLEEEKPVIKTDIAGLERLINLPARPTHVKWSTSTRPGGNDWSLAAVLTFKAEDTHRLIASPEASPDGQFTVRRESFVNLFPPAVQDRYKAQLGAGKAEVEMMGVQVPGALFAAPEKSPAIHGRALVLEEHNIVYLGLFTM